MYSRVKAIHCVIAIDKPAEDDKTWNVIWWNIFSSDMEVFMYDPNQWPESSCQSTYLETTNKRNDQSNGNGFPLRPFSLTESPQMFFKVFADNLPKLCSAQNHNL